MLSPLGWFVGFLTWFLVLFFIGLFSDLLVVRDHSGGENGSIPDEAFDYLRERPSFIPEDAFLLDTHSHTLASDGRMTPEQNIKWHIANGFNAFVVSDHNTGKNNEPSMILQEKYPSILIIPGYEWTTPRIHMNFIGILDFPYPVPRKASDKDIKQAIDRAQDLGAIIQCDHVSWTVSQDVYQSRNLVHPTRQELIEWGVDGFEINNSMQWYDGRTVHVMDFLEQNGLLEKPVFLSTGTDIHDPRNSFVTGWTELLLTPGERENASIDIVKQALREGRTKVWLDHDYHPSHEAQYREGTGGRVLLKPFRRLGNKIYSSPPRETAAWVTCLILLYFPAMALFHLLFVFF
ncbi:hypothetical protein GF325_04070 [Candidatus Bathyarchaeota archaeon]|nr:hypothetical protein [Candidatus Bathyarchaeota archaeon]